MKRKIRFWHSRNEDLVKRVASICEQDGDDFYWSGSIDEFAEHFNSFLVMPGIIAITHHSSFGAR